MAETWSTSHEAQEEKEEDEQHGVHGNENRVHSKLLSKLPNAFRIIVCPIVYLSNFMLKLMARVPLVLCILLICMTIMPPSVSALPDTADPNLGQHLNQLAGLAALAAAAAAAALAADNPSETPETPSASDSAPRRKPKPTRRKKRRLSAENCP